MNYPPKSTWTSRRTPVSAKDRYERHLDADIRHRQAMAPEQSVSSDYVRGVILKDLDARTGQDGAWTVDPRRIKARESWVFKAHTRLCPWPLAVKVYCAAVTGEVVIKQSQHLLGYHKSMANCPDLTVPAVWASLPERRTLVLQWIEEPRMDVLLRQARRQRTERARLFTAAGQWLRHYHAQSEATMRPLNVKQFPLSIDMLLGGENGAGQRVRDAGFREAYQALIGHADTFAMCRVPHVMEHGDFAPHNIFHGSGRTIGFDMVPAVRPALKDICHFLVDAELKKPFFTWHSTLGPTGIEQGDLKAFFDGYGALEDLGSPSLLAYMQLNETLVRWAYIISHVRKGRRMRLEHVSKWHRYRRMARCAARALQHQR